MEEEKMPADSKHFEYIAPNFNTNLLCINSKRELRVRTLEAKVSSDSACFSQSLPTIISWREKNVEKAFFTFVTFVHG